MNPEARRVVTLARKESTPTGDDRRRVRAAVGVGLAAAVTATTATTASVTAKAAMGAAMSTGVRVLVSALALATASAGAGVVWWKHAHTTVKPAPMVQAPAMTAAPPPTDMAAAPPAPEPPAAPSAMPVLDLPVAPPARAHAAGAPQDMLASELKLLHAARQAWQDGRAQTALDMARRHAQLYPHSQLADERQALEVFALCGLGRTSEARDLAAALLAKSPSSPLRPSLQQSCAARVAP